MIFVGTPEAYGRYPEMGIIVSVNNDTLYLPANSKAVQKVHTDGSARPDGEWDILLADILAGLKSRQLNIWLFLHSDAPCKLLTLDDLGRAAFRELSLDEQDIVRRILCLHENVYQDTTIDMLLLHNDCGILVSVPKSTARRFDPFHVQNGYLVYRDHTMPMDGTVEEARCHIQEKSTYRVISDDIFPEAPS